MLLNIRLDKKKTEDKTAVTASLHAFGINIQGQECAKNARKRPAKAWLEVS